MSPPCFQFFTHLESANLVCTYEQQHFLEKARVCYERALHMATAIERRDAMLEVEYRMGHVYLEQRDFPLAMKHFQAARLMAEQEGNRYLLAQIDAYLGFLETDTL